MNLWNNYSEKNPSSPVRIHIFMLDFSFYLRYSFFDVMWHCITNFFFFVYLMFYIVAKHLLFFPQQYARVLIKKLLSHFFHLSWFCSDDIIFSFFCFPFCSRNKAYFRGLLLTMAMWGWVYDRELLVNMRS